MLLFPGRTEYVEKYGPAAGELAARGYATLTVDWRGQGLADRPLKDANTGHVARFSDYQKDIAALLDHAVREKLPKPWFLLTHSMGGAIGLRALYNALPVKAVAFWRRCGASASTLPCGLLPGRCRAWGGPSDAGICMLREPHPRPMSQKRRSRTMY